MKRRTSPFLTLALLSMLCLLPSARGEEKSPAQELREIIEAAESFAEKKDYKQAADTLVKALKHDATNPNLHHSLGQYYFFAAEIDSSLKHFDMVVQLNPDSEPYLWQLGITQYYAEEFERGKRLFEIHRTVNGNDVENSAWHFLCVAQLQSAEAAEKILIPVTGDTRVPMAEVQRMFAGELPPEDVIKAASNGHNALCYAHLYVGLYHEAFGNDELGLKHIKLAATDYKHDHYMGIVAQVHLQLRSGEEK